MQQDDITIGIPVAGRKHEELAEMVGVFLNVLVIRTKLEKEIACIDYLQQVKNRLMEAQEHQDYPYEELYAKIKEQGIYHHPSLFSILFNYMPYEEESSIDLDGLTIRFYPSQEVEAKFGLTLYVSEGRDSIGLNAVFQSTLDEQLISIIMNSFPQVIASVLANAEIPLRQISLAGTASEQYTADFSTELDNDDLF